MPKTTRTTVQCPNCRQPVNAIVEMIVDAAQDPEAKMRLMAGRTNTVQCQNCGAAFTVASPLLYHDPAKELLIEFIPMEVNLPKPQQEKILGDLMRELMQGLPQEQRKGYLFQPRRSLTMQGLIDQILQADGVTPEMMQEQRQRVQLIEQLIQASDEDLPALIAEHDAEIDAQFFQTMSILAQRRAEERQTDSVERIVQVQRHILDHSSFGQELAMQEQAVQDVAQRLEALGDEADRSDFLDLAIEYAGDERHLQALVGLVRPAFDQLVFQELAMRIGQAPADEREALENLRDILTEYTAEVDKQMQIAAQKALELLQLIVSSPNPDQTIMQNLPLMDETFLSILAGNIQQLERQGNVEASASLKSVYEQVVRAQAAQNALGLLQAILSSPNPSETIIQNLPIIDDMFLAVLSANIQEAERQGNLQAASTFKNVYNQVVTVLQQNMQPELLFINQLLSAPTEDDARQLISENAPEFGEELLEVMDAVGEALEARGDEAMLGRLAFLRDEVERVIASLT
ncbi:MAG: CpXC domain-containing protein [Burkholderiales bacterium]|nr:CpXC domain-containing protein [Anaerolineae bacterium]